MNKKSLFYHIFSIISVEEGEHRYGQFKVTVGHSTLRAGPVPHQAQQGPGLAPAQNLSARWAFAGR